MESLELFGTGITIKEELRLPQPDNDNWQMKAEWKTPAELIQWIRRTKDEMRRERVADESLLSCPKHRRIWTSLQAIERCARWHYYGERD